MPSETDIIMVKNPRNLEVRGNSLADKRHAIGNKINNINIFIGSL
jgi:hypothetical protein